MTGGNLYPFHTFQTRVPGQAPGRTVDRSEKSGGISNMLGIIPPPLVGIGFTDFTKSRGGA